MNLIDKLLLNKNIPPLLKGKGSFVIDDIMGFSLLIATIYKKTGKRYTILVSNLYKAQKLYSLLCTFIDAKKISLFPMDELIRAEAIAEGKEMMAQRLFSLYAIKNKEVDILIVNVAAANRYMPNPKIFDQQIINFKVGTSKDFNEIRKSLILSGYSLVNKIDQSLQFAIRGDILDIFSVNLPNPVRIEFFDNEIESIRYFDISTQMSTDKLSEVEILPACDMILTDEEVSQGVKKIDSVYKKALLNLPSSVQDRLVQFTEKDITDIIERNYTPRIYKYFSFITENHYSIFDYCKDFEKIVFDVPQVLNENSLLIDESWNYLEDLVTEGNIIPGLEINRDISREINDASMLMTYPLKHSCDDIEINIHSVPFFASKEKDSLDIIHTYLNDGYKIIVTLSNNEQLNETEKLLMVADIPFTKMKNISIPDNSNIGLVLYNLEQGCVLEDEKVVILSTKELLNIKTRSIRYTNKFKEATILRSYEDLEPGDYVVHEYQGIGQFVSLETLEVDGIHKDFLKIAYAGTDVLYVPLDQFQLVRKYMGKEGHAPKLSKLHSKDWENTKKRIKERVNELAERLIHLYTERSKIQGYSFQKDDEFQKQFESSFPYKLTKDQQKSLDEIKKDMESSTPMDRLLCGDVGFGKTEVAFRAAFKAINSGKQVAILCPTTLLARQHFERAVERFAQFDIKVALFSRLVSEKQEKEYLEGVRNGTIHLVIGTHKLLSKKLIFKDLGLLIVDEEQRFGVEQKERIKELKTNLDVLTLTATPIPRTLQISLLGVRSMSMINTAPEDRMPVQTYVVPYKTDVIKELIERELGRNGQVFYLHNNISTLYNTASKLQKLVPGATIGVAHGQMDRDSVDSAMVKFSNNEINLLVCTSIIENGIDIPNANMIIVEDSDRYGLAQLYQIKGRVGRSDRIAYAYLMYNGNKVLNEKAEKRLQAIKDFTALGSGYKIAQRDLMIRGAGDILGPDQAGFIDSIGLDMYIKLLNEAVKEKLTGIDQEEKVEANVNLDIDAYIPSNYASNVDKIELYQTIDGTKTIEDLAIVEIKMRDIYGKIPNPVHLLLKKRAIDILSSTAKLADMRVLGSYVDITLGNDYLKIKGVGNLLFESLIPFIGYTKISYIQRQFKIRMDKRRTWVDDLENMLKCLSQVVTTNNKIEE
ncbi:MAG: transcription-repair coupling factor [Erysipelotrichaceae bacterium]|nr:transcription-repair coupling factor [Erysipelotrichaceae bacterium]